MTCLFSVNQDREGLNMKVLFLGDVVGESGCRILESELYRIKNRYGIDVTVINGENSAVGNGITPESFDRLVKETRAIEHQDAAVVRIGILREYMGPEFALAIAAFSEKYPDVELKIIRGNHDYWWEGITKVRAALPEGMYALQQDAADLGDAVVCGTRGWLIPGEEMRLEPQDEKIYQRELIRLELALDHAKSLAKGRPVVVMLHYPPLLRGQRESGFTRRMEAAGVQMCVYGHLHGAGIAAGWSCATAGRKPPRCSATCTI